jgi:hypothetical protein
MRSVTGLVISLNGSSGKVIPFFGYGHMDKCGWRFTQRNVKVLCGMLMNSWTILGSVALIIYFKHNIVGGGCSCKSNNLIFSVWCVTKFEHYSLHLQPLPIMGFEYWWNLDFVYAMNLTFWHNQYVLIMIKYFSKWLELVLLLDCSNEGTSYAFLNKVFNRFGAPT